MSKHIHTWPAWLGIVVTALLVSGCASGGLGSFRLGSGAGPDAIDVQVQTPDADTVRPEARPQTGTALSLGAQGQSADALDITAPEARAAALMPASTSAVAPDAELGETLAGLGSPAEAGFWLRTGLVTQVTPGRVVPVSGGDGVRVELRPSGAAPGAGSQMSLAAFRALSLPLTELVRLRVYRN